MQTFLELAMTPMWLDAHHWTLVDTSVIEERVSSGLSVLLLTPSGEIQSEVKVVALQSTTADGCNFNSLGGETDEWG